MIIKDYIKKTLKNNFFYLFNIRNQILNHNTINKNKELKFNNI